MPPSEKANKHVEYKDFPVICRVCLSREPIHPFELNLLEVFKLILNTTENEIERKLPQNICESCSKQLQEVEAFIEKCKSNEQILRIAYSEKENKYSDLSDTDSDVEDGFTSTEINCEDSDPVKRNKNISENNSRGRKLKLKRVPKKSRKKSYSTECKLCNKTFCRKTAYVNHMRAHKENKKFLCNICGKDVIKNSDLERHIRSHMGIKPYECKECGKCFGENSELKRHLLRHTNEKNFGCSFCDKKFNMKEYLRAHARTHSVVKPYQCAHCGKQFCQKMGLNNHMLTHTGEKPYKCEICEKAFFRATHLKEHSRIHNGEKPFLCTYCGKSFTYSSTFKVHLRQHTGETSPLVCVYCNKGFNYPSNLKRHIHRHHSNVRQSKNKNTEDTVDNSDACDETR